MDNMPPGAPLIPMGTEKTVFNANSFPAPKNDGQAPNMPNAGQSGGEGTPPSVPNAPEGITFEQLAATKGWKSPDDLAKAYANLESLNSRVRGQMSVEELAKSRIPAASAPAPVPVPASTPAASPVGEINSPEDAVRVIQGLIAQEVQPLKDQFELQRLFMNNPEAVQYATQMADLVKANPGMTWENAFKLSRYEPLAAKEREEKNRLAQEDVRLKQVAMVGGGRPPARGEEVSIDQIIADRNVPFSEVQRVMRERFAQ